MPACDEKAPLTSRRPHRTVVRMSRRWLSNAGNLLCVILLTPLLLYATTLGIALVLSLVVGPSPESQGIAATVALTALAPAATSFITARVGKTLPVVVLSAVAPVAFYLYQDWTAGIGARPTPVVLTQLVFASGVAGAYVAWRMRAKRQTIFQ